MSVLNIAEADRILRAAKAKALVMDVKVTISVVDPRGDLITMARLDGASWRSIQISHGKAYASAAYGQSSAELAERAEHPVMRSLILMEGGHLVPSQGALPINRGDELIGAIGTSGAAPEEDEAVCQAGIDALSSLQGGV